MLPATPFYMIRHGETEANFTRILAGHTDTPLTDTGRQQAMAVQDIVKSLATRPVAIIHSHLSRARDTAAIINEVLNIPAHEDQDIAELFAGDWEGQPYDVCKGAFTGQHNAPNGETFQDFLVRVKRGVGSALTQFDSPVLIVCHGGVMRAFGGIYGLMVPARFKNCHLYEFQPAPEALPFPWDSYSYDYDESTQLVTRRRNDIYDSSTPLSDALPIQARS